MIVKPSKYYGRSGEDPKTWFKDFVLDAETNAWTTRNHRLLKKVGGFLAKEARNWFQENRAGFAIFDNNMANPRRDFKV